jgi:hypothetical protein
MRDSRRASCTALVASDCAQWQKFERATKGPGSEKNKMRMSKPIIPPVRSIISALASINTK